MAQTSTNTPAPLAAEITRTIKTLVAARNMTLTKLALKTGIPKSRLYDRTSGAWPDWTVSELDAIADALDVTVADLFRPVDDLLRTGRFTAPMECLPSLAPATPTPPVRGHLALVQ